MPGDPVFEVFLDQPRSRHVSTLVDVQADLAETNSSIAMASGLVWGEHFTECAWPACYSNCSLYTPRSDLNCRRFEDGIVPVSLDMGGGDAGRGMRVSFRQWGKLEAHEEVRLSSVGNLTLVARADEMVRKALRLDAPFSVGAAPCACGHLDSVSTFDHWARHRHLTTYSFWRQSTRARNRSHSH